MKRIYIKEMRPVNAAEYDAKMRQAKARAVTASEHYRGISNRNQTTVINRGAYIPDLHIIDGRLYKECLISAPEL